MAGPLIATDMLAGLLGQPAESPKAFALCDSIVPHASFPFAPLSR